MRTAGSLITDPMMVFTTALWPTSSWTPGRLSDSAWSLRLIYYIQLISDGARVGIPEGTKIQTNPGLTVYDVQKVGPECIG